VNYIFADSLDFVDPNYDFVNDLPADGRQAYWDDFYPHEILSEAPYDGMLVSRAIVEGSGGLSGRYSESQVMRFRRIGAREFLRFNSPENISKPIFGDCGAFSYANLATPPYTPEDTVEFYGDGQFTHGCSVDHIIFEFDANAKGLNSGSEISRERFEITLQLASEFWKESQLLAPNFTPVGVAQGWSPESLADAARQLAKMGYRYIAIGGLVPLNVDEIHIAIGAIEDAIKQWPDIKLHLLGFAKADNLGEFMRYKSVASFDSTSPLIRAFKDDRRNYYERGDSEKLEYYAAIRIPQSSLNNRLNNHVKTGRYVLEDLIKLEKDALDSIRGYDAGKVSLEDALDALIAYSEPLHRTASISEESMKRKLHTLRMHYKRTLEAMPWRSCGCEICKTAGVETIIFRASNRNKRRGMHNLYVFHNHFKNIKSI